MRAYIMESPQSYCYTSQLAANVVVMPCNLNGNKLEPPQAPRSIRADRLVQTRKKSQGAQACAMAPTQCGGAVVMLTPYVVPEESY